jgi:hypothetical protein
MICQVYEPTNMSKECSNGLLRTAMGHNHYLFSIVVSDYLSQHSSF